MITSYFISIVILLIISVLESTWLSAITIFRPDISILVLIYISFYSNSAQGIVSGFFSGLIIDGTSLAPWGYTAFMRTILAWIYSIFSGKLILDKIFIPMLMGFTATIAKYIIMLFLFLLFKTPSLLSSIINYNTLLEIGLNSLAAPIVFFLLSLLFKFINPKKERL